MNNFTNIIAHNLACSNKEGKSLIYQEDDLGGSSLNKPSDKKVFSYESLEVRTVTLDRFLKKLNARIGLVKIDVEGHEPLVIEGMKNIIKKHRPLMIIEFLQRGLNNVKQGQDLEFLEALNKDYELTEIERNKKVLDVKKYVEEFRRKDKTSFSRNSNFLLIPRKKISPSS